MNAQPPPTEAGQQGNGWLPIETAPDNADVILRLEYKDGRAFSTSGNIKHWIKGFVREPFPSHWQPLPSPDILPTAARKGDEAAQPCAGVGPILAAPENRPQKDTKTCSASRVPASGAATPAGESAQIAAVKGDGGAGGRLQRAEDVQDEFSAWATAYIAATEKCGGALRDKLIQIQTASNLVEGLRT